MNPNLPVRGMGSAFASMDSVAFALSTSAALAIASFAFRESLGSSVIGGTGTYLALALLAVQLASAGFVLGVASLCRSVRSPLAWSATIIGLAILVLELVFTWRAFQYEFGP